MGETEREAAAERGAEVRQYNSRVPVGVYQVLKFVAIRRGLSLGKLVEEVLTDYAKQVLDDAKEEARKAVAEAQREASALAQLEPDSLSQASRPRPPRRRRAS
ncbi:MAG TPA: hypothetical protein VF711_09375 [Acidimicrobiales bacterium]